MFIQLIVENFRSFAERQSFSMVASKAVRRLRDENTFESELADRGAPKLLKTSAVFGPNASGKSNLVKAFRFLEDLVITSARADADDPIEVQPFRLDPAKRESDSFFEIHFIEDGVRYQFGVTVNATRITSEWLIAYPKARPQLYYERKFNIEHQKDEYVFGANLEGGRIRRDWASQTGPKTLYLSRVVQQSSEEFQQLRKPYSWFKNRLRVMPTDEHRIGRNYTLKKCSGDEKSDVLAFMNNADVPIADLTVLHEPLDVVGLSKTLSEEFLRKLVKDQSAEGVPHPKFFHRGINGDLIEFEEDDESDGTRALFAFAGPWNDVLENDYVLVVDELDTSLHPLIVRRLIEILNKKGKKAQLIFTTHDTSIMSSRILRRDQYWFTQRDARGASSLYSLHDFKGREEDPIQSKYFEGSFGALPVLRSLWRHG